MVSPVRFCSLLALLATLYYDCVNAPPCQGWQFAVPYGNHCYGVIPNPGPMDFGETQCNALFDGGHLASVESEAENNFITANFTAFVWLGGMRTNGQWYWTDYRPFGYVNWMIPGYPLIDFSSNCLAIYPNGSWYNTKCSENRNALCKIPEGSFTPNASSTTFTTSTTSTTTEYTTPIPDPCIGMDCVFGNCSVNPLPPFGALCHCSNNPCYANVDDDQSKPCTVPVDPCVNDGHLCNPDGGGFCRPNITNGCIHECLCPPDNDTALFCNVRRILFNAQLTLA